MKRRISDCFFYYNGYCYKGDTCRFRHEPRAFGCRRVCELWMRRSCYRVRCPLRHAQFHGHPVSSPRFRTDRTPFLKGRYSRSQGCTCANGKWIRKAYFSTLEPRIHWPERNARFQISEARIPEDHPQRQTIRVVLLRVCDQTLACGANSGTENKNLQSTSLEIKRENFQSEASGTMVLKRKREESEETPAVKFQKVADAGCKCSKNENNELFQENSSKGFIQSNSTLRSTESAVPYALNDTNFLSGNVFHRVNNSKSSVFNSNCNSNDASICWSADTFNCTPTLNQENADMSRAKINAKSSCSSEKYSSNKEILKKEVPLDQNEHASVPVVFVKHKATEKSNMVCAGTEIPSTSLLEQTLSPSDGDSKKSLVPPEQTCFVGYYTRLQARIRAEREKKCVELI